MKVQWKNQIKMLWSTKRSKNHREIKSKLSKGKKQIHPISAVQIDVVQTDAVQKLRGLLFRNRNNSIELTVEAILARWGSKCPQRDLARITALSKKSKMRIKNRLHGQILGVKIHRSHLRIKSLPHLFVTLRQYLLQERLMVTNRKLQVHLQRLISH